MLKWASGIEVPLEVSTKHGVTTASMVQGTSSPPGGCQRNTAMLDGGGRRLHWDDQDVWTIVDADALGERLTKTSSELEEERQARLAGRGGESAHALAARLAT